MATTMTNNNDNNADTTTPLPPTDVFIDKTRSDETARTSLLSEEGSDNSFVPPGGPSSQESIEQVATKPKSSGTAATPPPGPWKDPYESAPLVDQTTILGWGVFLFGLSVIWPPLILLFAYVASKLIPYSFRADDCPVRRRRLFAEFARQEDLPENFKSFPRDVNLEDGYWTNRRGMLLHTVSMTPKRKPIKAVVFYCHGYADNVSFEKILYKQRLVQEGIAFCAIEYEGHGLSDGAMGLIGDWSALVEDVTEYVQHISERFADKPLFLMGESMGGAVAFSVQQRLAELIHGVVFVCPMCKISDEMLPPQPVIDILRWLIGPSGEETSWLGYLPIAPARGEMVTHKDADKLLLASRVPLCFGRNPRLATARELIAVTQDISSRLADFDAPFLVVHGLSDTVTDPQLSQALYEESKSTDKSIRLYDGMWHALMCGEPDENSDVVFRDCIGWILERVED